MAHRQSGGNPSEKEKKVGARLHDGGFNRTAQVKNVEKVQVGDGNVNPRSPNMSDGDSCFRFPISCYLSFSYQFAGLRYPSAIPSSRGIQEYSPCLLIERVGASVNVRGCDH